MKRLIICIEVTIFLFLLSACASKEDPIVLLKTADFDTTPRIVGLTEKVRIKVNQAVTWKTSAGSMAQTSTDTLVFTPLPTGGIFDITLKGVRNPKDSLVISVIATARADVFKPLQRGGYALIFRHAAADVGSDQTNSALANWWKSCDSKTARQLNDQGKKEAQAIGTLLKKMQLPIARLFSSEFCRCFTTADLMGLNLPVQQLKDLTYYVYDENNRYGNTMKIAASQPIDNQNSVLIIHAGFSGTLPSPAPLSTLNWGDAAVFQLEANQTARYVATLAVKDFTELVK